MRTARAIPVLVALTMMSLASCGDDDGTADSTPATTEEPAPTTTEEPAPTTSEEPTPATTDAPTTTSAETPSAEGLGVTIEVLEAEDPGGFGSFEVSGPAVDGGVTCADGDGMIVRLFDADSGEPPPWPTDPENLLVDWEFTCSDGSGQFIMQLAQPAYTEEDHERFVASGGTGEVHGEGSTWQTLSGTDGYETLSGAGTYTFEVLDPSGRPSLATWVGTVSSGGGETQSAGFSSERDDLCHWVTGDDVVEFVTAAGFAVEGPATASEPATEDTTGWDCAWTFSSGEELQLGVRDRPGSLAAMEVVEYQEPGQIMDPGATVSGHPELSVGVVVENNAFLRFAFYTPGRDDVLNVMFWSEKGGSEDGYEVALMAVSDSVLSDLGWVPD